MNAIALKDARDLNVSDEVIRDKFSDIYMHLMQHVEANFKQKQWMSMHLCAVWLDESGRIVNSGMSPPLLLMRPCITMQLDELLLKGLPNLPTAPISVAAATMFVVDENQGDGVLMLLKSRGHEAEQFTQVHRDKRSMTVLPLRQENIRVNSNFLILH